MLPRPGGAGQSAARLDSRRPMRRRTGAPQSGARSRADCRCGAGHRIQAAAQGAGFGRIGLDEGQPRTDSLPSIFPPAGRPTKPPQRSRPGFPPTRSSRSPRPNPRTSSASSRAAGISPLSWRPSVRRMGPSSRRSGLIGPARRTRLPGPARLGQTRATSVTFWWWAVRRTAGKSGAPAMTSLAALRSGAGLVTAAVPAPALPQVSALRRS